jgi:hypothetical protein
VVLRDSLDVGDRRGRLNGVTDSHDSCVDLEGIDGLQEELVEARRDEVESSWVLGGGFEVSNELESFKVVGECSERDDKWRMLES